MPRTETTPRRRRKADTTDAPTANSLVASAAQVTSRRKRGRPASQGANGWQAEAQRMLYEVGELEFYREWKSNAMSRVTLYVTRTLPDGTKERVTSGLAVDALRALFGGEQGQSQMLARLAGLLAFPGEAQLVGLLDEAMAGSNDPDAPDRWRVLSTNEVKQENGKVLIDLGDGEPESYSEGRGQQGDEDYVAPQVYVSRIWEPDPFVSVQAHSAVRSALPILRELVGLTKRVARDVDSRLVSAGVLILPQEATFAAPLTGELAEDPTMDPLLSTFIETASAAIRDQDSAEGNVPIIIRVPAQYVEHVKHLTFWSELSSEARELRGEALSRLATTLSCPAEVLTGMGDINHWGQWFTDETGIKMYIEPDVNTVVHALTTRYLRPCLIGPNAGAMTAEEAVTYQIEGDTAALRQRPNRSAEAADAHANMIITDAAYARERGFEETDLLSNPANAEEYHRRLLQSMATKGTLTPDLVSAAAAQIGVSLVPKPSTAPGAPTTATVTGVTPDTPPAVEAPTQHPPEPTEDAQVAALAQRWQLTALAGMAEGAVERAVERAWNRAGKRRGGERRPVPADQLDACLVGAWEDRVPRIAAMTGTDQDRLRRALDAYTRQLLVTGAEYDPPAFAAMLRDRVLTDAPEAIGA